LPERCPYELYYRDEYLFPISGSSQQLIEHSEWTRLDLDDTYLNAPAKYHLEVTRNLNEKLSGITVALSKKDLIE
jgi:hypothetical protein